MPVPASNFTAPIYAQIFTHFTRSEDEQLSNGRLSEELQRMSNMVNKTVPNSLFLLNESFASTTEKEGSKIAEGIKISRRTLRIVYENLMGSLGIKGVILILSALGISNMWLAVFGAVGVTILAVLNCLRLFSKTRGEK